MISHLPPATVSVPPAMQNGNIGSSSPNANANDNAPNLSSKRSFLGKGTFLGYG